MAAPVQNGLEYADPSYLQRYRYRPDIPWNPHRVAVGHEALHGLNGLFYASHNLYPERRPDWLRRARQGLVLWNDYRHLFRSHWDHFERRRIRRAMFRERLRRTRIIRSRANQQDTQHRRPRRPQ